MSDNPETAIRRDIDYNSTNLDELGRFIRIDYVLNILDRYEIAINDDGVRQLNRFEEARKILHSASNVGTDTHAVLRELARVLL